MWGGNGVGGWRLEVSCVAYERGLPYERERSLFDFWRHEESSERHRFDTVVTVTLTLLAIGD